MLYLLGGIVVFAFTIVFTISMTTRKRELIKAKLGISPIKLKITIPLFLILMLFAPSHYYIFVAAGFLPPIFYLFYIVGSNQISITLLWLAHLSIYSVLFFAISYATIELVCKICTPKNFKVVISSLLIALVLLISISLLPIYVIGGHSRTSTTNIFGAYKSAGAISEVPWQRH